ncbi:MAG: adenosine kinase [Treponema sp.]|jgi:fructokinase|nr:adenosine kinase [Treponema sp.]
MTGKNIDILCIGNALVDVFAETDEDTLQRYGITRPVQHVEIEKLIRFLDECNIACPPEKHSPLIITSGGGAANVAKIAGYLGAKVCFTGAIANDNFGQFFEKELSAAKVEVKLCRKSLPTGICLMLRTGSETRIAASPSAALELSESDIDVEDIKNARVVIIDGFMLDRPNLVRYILALAAQYETVAAIDLSAASIAGKHAMEIMDYAGQQPLILFMNESEAETWCQALIYSRKDSHRGPKTRSLLIRFVNFFSSSVPLCLCVRKFGIKLTRELPGTIIVVTLGERGAVCFTGGEVHDCKTEAITPTETTGAGDAFAAGFLTAWTRSRSLGECAAMGNKVAGLVLHTEGTRLDGKRLKGLEL